MSPLRRLADNPYLRHARHLLRHKANVFRAGLHIRRRLGGGGPGLVALALHDLSSFLPDEFLPMARYKYGSYPTVEEVHADLRRHVGRTEEEVQDAGVFAEHLHSRRNRHEPEWWAGLGHFTARSIPRAVLLELLADQMARALEDSAVGFGDYAAHYGSEPDLFALDPRSREEFEDLLCLLVDDPDVQDAIRISF